MQTVAEFAKAMGVSVQTVYRHINRMSPDSARQAAAQQGAKLYITDFGAAALAKSIALNQAGASGGQSAEEKSAAAGASAEEAIGGARGQEEIARLREENQILRGELAKEREHSRGQAEKMAALAERMAQIAQNSQALLGAEQIRGAPPALGAGAAECLPGAEGGPGKPPKESRLAAWVKRVFLDGGQG